MTLEALFGPGPLASAVAPRTALRVEEGLPRHREAHEERLRLALVALGADPAWLGAALAEAWDWVREASTGTQALRLQADPATRSLRALLEPLPESVQPYTLLPMPHPFRDHRGDPLAPHKGCRGPWSREVLARAREAGALDALLLWADGSLAESAIAAVGWVQGSRLWLPSPEGRVRSIAELRDLPRWADERGWTVAYGSPSLQEASTGQLWCFNALRGLWPARLFATAP